MATTNQERTQCVLWYAKFESVKKVKRNFDFKVCHGSLYAVMWLADEPREFNLHTLPQGRITHVPEKLPGKYCVHSEECVYGTVRFSPKVNGKSIEDSLKNQLSLSSLVVTKLKTKYETYSSFHISVEEKDFHLINNTGVWPVGCLIAPFYGKLKPEQHYASTAREPEGSNGNAS
ncbi:hypothetical protein ANN_10634 [Periplaneta americana]|uniref:Uncharacterized protein n=1 Tax=Periplaneta americana TaxID=6978 RepID=A0ABQ8T2U9_PERAM|nr:hypothetical protein ANN_10634 [Periplaneta americana]